MLKGTVVFLVSVVLLCEPVSAGLYSSRKTRPRPLTKRTRANVESRASGTAVRADGLIPVTRWGERKYDKNRDGYLQPHEARALLKDRYPVLRSKRNPKVGNGAEKRYDINGNGILEKDEIAKMGADIKT